MQRRQSRSHNLARQVEVFELVGWLIDRLADSCSERGVEVVSLRVRWQHTVLLSSNLGKRDKHTVYDGSLEVVEEEEEGYLRWCSNDWVGLLLDGESSL